MDNILVTLFFQKFYNFSTAPGKHTFQGQNLTFKIMNSQGFVLRHLHQYFVFYITANSTTTRVKY